MNVLMDPKKTSLMRLVTLSALCVSFVVNGENENVLRVDFSKINAGGRRSDTVVGTFYSINGRMVIKVSSPITQFMLVDSLCTLIYNPLEQTGVQIRRKNRAFLPCFHAFMGFFSRVTAVPGLNFHIKGTQKRNDSLYTQWVPDDRKSSFNGRIETVHYKDTPVRTSTYDGKSRLMYEMLYSHDTLIDGHHIPMHIATVEVWKNNTVREDVFFSKLAVGKTIPSEILHFKIPSEIPIKVIEW
jgi:hypothetical protein